MDPINKVLDRNTMNVTFLDPISGDTYGYLNLVFRLMVNPILSIAGMFLNTVNIMVFYKMGLSDGVARNFFILALSDCLYAAVAFLNKLLIIIMTYPCHNVHWLWRLGAGDQHYFPSHFLLWPISAEFFVNHNLRNRCRPVLLCCDASQSEIPVNSPTSTGSHLVFFGYCHLYFGVRYGSNEAYLSTKSENKHYPRLFCWGTLVHICSIQQFSFLRKFHHLYRMCYYSLGQSS